MGEILALASAFCFGAANVSIMYGAGEQGEDNGAFLSILMTCLSGASLWFWHVALDGWPVMHTESLLWFAGAGILTIFIGRVFLFNSVQHLGAVRASAIKRLNPVFSVLIGVLLLNDPFDLGMALGMGLIFASFGVLIWQSLTSSTDPETEAANTMAKLGRLGFFYGPVSALAYACGYVARKQGLNITPDASLGTMVGAGTGAIVFLLIALRVPSYRLAVSSTFTSFNPWLYAAGFLSSAGQLLYFAALSHSSISRVAMICSMEAFVTIFITVLLARSFKQLNGPVILAAALGVVGTIFIVWQ
jgi:drug/metabolite transporter (DMT)-like permease